MASPILYVSFPQILSSNFDENWQRRHGIDYSIPVYGLEARI
jgi:hypothetical protein